MSNQCEFFDNFPSEVTLEIFRRLDTVSLRRIRRVSRTWRDVIDDPASQLKKSVVFYLGTSASPWSVLQLNSDTEEETLRKCQSACIGKETKEIIFRPADSAAATTTETLSFWNRFMDELAIHYDNLFPNNQPSQKQHKWTSSSKKMKTDPVFEAEWLGKMQEMPPLRTMTFVNLTIPKVALCWLFISPFAVRNVHLRNATLYAEFERESWFTMAYHFDDKYFDTRKQDELEWGICWDDYRWFSYIAKFIGPLKEDEEQALLKALRDAKTNTSIKEELDNRDVLDSLSENFWTEFQDIDRQAVDLDWIRKWDVWTQRFLLNFVRMAK